MKLYLINGCDEGRQLPKAEYHVHDGDTLLEANAKSMQAWHTEVQRVARRILSRALRGKRVGNNALVQYILYS